MADSSQRTIYMGAGTAGQNLETEFENAAAELGLSFGQFMIEAALEKIERMKNKEASHGK